MYVQYCMQPAVDDLHAVCLLIKSFHKQHQYEGIRTHMCQLGVQERLLGDDGHPRKVHEGEDPNRMGLVLEWVYGTIVSTAEKARDGAKRALGQSLLSLVCTPGISRACCLHT